MYAVYDGAHYCLFCLRVLEVLEQTETKEMLFAFAVCRNIKLPVRVYRKPEM